MNQLIKVSLGIIETFRQVCWTWLELNSAGHRPSRTEIGDHCNRAKHGAVSKSVQTVVEPEARVYSYIQDILRHG